MSYGEDFRTLLRDERRRAGVTQFQLAVAVGLQQAVSISRYERGRGLPDPAVFERVIAALDMDPEVAWPLWGLAYAERARAALGLSEG